MQEEWLATHTHSWGYSSSADARRWVFGENLVLPFHVRVLSRATGGGGGIMHFKLVKIPRASCWLGKTEIRGKVLLVFTFHGVCLNLMISNAFHGGIVGDMVSGHQHWDDRMENVRFLNELKRLFGKFPYTLWHTL